MLVKVSHSIEAYREPDRADTDLSSQYAVDRSDKPGDRLSLLSPRQAVTSPVADYHRSLAGTNYTTGLIEAQESLSSHAPTAGSRTRDDECTS